MATVPASDPWHLDVLLDIATEDLRQVYHHYHSTGSIPDIYFHLTHLYYVLDAINVRLPSTPTILGYPVQ